MFVRVLALSLMFLVTGCATAPPANNQNLDEWQEYTINLSDAKVYFESPKYAATNSDPVFVSDSDIYDDSLYINKNKDKVLLLRTGWEWYPKRKIYGKMNIIGGIKRYPPLSNGSKGSIMDIIDNQDRRNYEKDVSNGWNGPFIPIRYKGSAQFSINGPKWLIYDRLLGPDRVDNIEMFAYPIDDTHFFRLDISFSGHFPRYKNDQSYKTWYPEARAVADRIMASVRIEGTTPMPDIEYGVKDFGIVSPSSIPYVDELFEPAP